MPYILNKTNGTKLLVVDDATLDVSTSLTFVGRNYSGYGDYLNENFLYLLENFSSTEAPATPIQGQLWFNNDPTVRRLNVCYDGMNFKPIANLYIQDNQPSKSTQGDLWWDSTNQQLKAYDGIVYQIVGPAISAVAGATWNVDSEYGQEDPTAATPFIIFDAKIGYSPLVVISDDNFTPLTSSVFNTNFKKIKKGITIAGADPITGSSQKADTSTEYLFWGTAAEAKVANVGQQIKTATTQTGVLYLPLTDVTTGTANVYSTSSLYYTVQTGLLNATATAARYADLAERYEADSVYDFGTVLVIGGEKEVTTTDIRANTAVVGVVSQNPAYMMNSDAGNDDSHPYIALKGRIPCKVKGKISKGDLLVTSTLPGYACAFDKDSDSANAVFGKALQDNEDILNVIEVLII